MINKNQKEKYPKSPIGEVIETSAFNLTIQCHKLYESPAIGSLLKCGTETIVYSIISNIKTQSIDTTRTTIALAQNVFSVEDVYQENPQLQNLLSTSLNTIVVGYKQNTHINHEIPSIPPKIHDLTYNCTLEETLEFSQTFGFLRILRSSNSAHIDDVIVSFLRSTLGNSKNPSQLLLRAGQELARLLKDDTQRLTQILERISL